MGTQILMPALSPTMTEGKLARWLKHEGDEVKAGDVIAEIETDKATMEVEAVDEGKLTRIIVPEGTEGVSVNSPIAELNGGGGEAAQPRLAGRPPGQSRLHVPEHPVERRADLADLGPRVGGGHPLAELGVPVGQRQLSDPGGGRGDPAQRPQRDADQAGAQHASEQ